MGHYLQNFLTMLLIASLGGEFLLFWLKKLLVDPRIFFKFDLSGVTERMAIVTAFTAGGWFLLFVPLIILARASFMFDQSKLKKYSDIINREEPALEFQKVKLKSDFIITLLASPAIGILFGMLAKTL
ncbi:MAG: hypothetical protein ABH860_01535 [bacterium]